MTESLSRQRRPIIEKGVLKGFLYNTIVAKRAGVRSTGNASRGGFTGIPDIGPHNFYLAAARQDSGSRTAKSLSR